MADEVLLLNEKGEPCEGTITSIFLDDGSGILKTPPISCGLLAGVLRTELICARRARVQRLTLADLTDRHALYGQFAARADPRKALDRRTDHVHPVADLYGPNCPRWTAISSRIWTG